MRFVKAKPFFMNSGLVLSSLLAVYLVLEIAGTRLLISNASLDLQAHFPPAMRVLAQSSKKNVVPADYILLLGDSYAQGSGDWFLEADKSLNPPFHSAHVLHDLLDRDVISFGNGGAGSVPALTYIPVRNLHILQRFKVPQPESILVYFYEGNDLSDNLEYLRRQAEARKNAYPVLDASALDSVLVKEADKKASASVFHYLYFRYYLGTLLTAARDSILGKQSAEQLEEASQRLSLAPLGLAKDHVNKIALGGAQQEIPDLLQAPALQLTEAEIAAGLLVFERCFAYLQAHFPQSKIHIVYLPSPLAVYSLAGPQVSAQGVEEAPGALFPSGLVGERNRMISGKVQRIAEKYRVGFLDATNALRREGERAILHGPRDWKHLNKKGYAVLGETIAGYLSNAPR